jgi:ParB-like chromosome segregation protein Spo0J
MAADGQQVELAALGRGLERLRLTSPAATQQMAESLRTLGQLAPLLVVEAGGGLQVVDGFKRLHAAPQAGLRALNVVALPEDLGRAKAALLTANATAGLVEIEEAWVIRSLCRDHGWSQAEVARHVARHKSWVCRRLALAEQLAPEVEDDLRLGLLSMTAARELLRLPRGNQAPVAARVHALGLSTRETARLVDAVMQDGLQLALDSASKGAPRPAPRTPSPRSPAEHVLSTARTLSLSATRMQAHLHERPITTYEPGATELLATTLGELLRVLELLRQSIQDALQEAAP